jgi:hypothetical protein
MLGLWQKYASYQQKHSSCNNVAIIIDTSSYVTLHLTSAFGVYRLKNASKRPQSCICGEVWVKFRNL